jgi:hypothetical protein
MGYVDTWHHIAGSIAKANFPAERAKSSGSGMRAVLPLLEGRVQTLFGENGGRSGGDAHQHGN